MTTHLELVLPAGRMLADGRYRVVEPIGTPGGEGAVYRAWRAPFGPYVAVKVMHPGLYAMFRAAFDAQMELIAGLDHPCFVEVHDHFAIAAADGWPETAAIVMELAERSLADLIGPGGAPRREALAAALATARGLAHLHALGGTHNDVKPQNLLQVSVDGRSRWVIGDLGVAKLFDGTHTFQPSMDLRYAAPERLRWGHVRRPGDVFSLGMTLHEALCGKLPGGYGEYVVSPELDAASAELVVDCLRADPADRPTMEVVVHRLAQLVDDPVVEAAPAPPRRSVTLPPRRRAAAPPAPAPTPVPTVRPPTPPPRPVSRRARGSHPAAAPASKPRKQRRRRRPIRRMIGFVARLVRLTLVVVLVAAIVAVLQLSGGGASIPAPSRFLDVADRVVGRVLGAAVPAEVPVVGADPVGGRPAITS